MLHIVNTQDSTQAHTQINDIEYLINDNTTTDMALKLIVRT